MIGLDFASSEKIILKGSAMSTGSMARILRGFVIATLFCIHLCAAAQAQSRSKFAYSSVGSMATGVWMAKESGALDKYGLQSDIIFISSGPVVVQALIGGLNDEQRGWLYFRGMR